MSRRAVVITFDVADDPDEAAGAVRDALLGQLTDDGGADVAMVLGDDVADQATDFDVFVLTMSASDIDDAATSLSNEADRLHENDDEDEAESEEYGDLAERLWDFARQLKGTS